MARSPTLLEIIHHHAGYIRVPVSSAETGDAMIISKRAVAPGRGPAWHANRDCRPWSNSHADCAGSATSRMAQTGALIASYS